MPKMYPFLSKLLSKISSANGLPGLLPVGQVRRQSYLPEGKSTCPGRPDGGYFEPCVCPPKFCISTVSIFSWDHCKSQEKMETTFMQNFEGQTKSIIVFLKVAYVY